MICLAKRLGIYGGTFNPIHNGHISIASNVRKLFQLDEVWIVVSAQPPHKDCKNIIDSVHRFKMAQLAVQEVEHILVSAIELNRQGPNYTLDTIKLIKEGLEKDDRLYCIIGEDMLFDLYRWKNPQDLMENCEFIAVRRPGMRFTADEEAIRWVQKYQSRIQIAPFDGPDISSTAIRHRIKNKQTVEGLIPENVLEYIKINNLYL